VLLASLALGEEGCLKTRRDGTILDGHHRIHVLRSRGIDVDKFAERCGAEGSGITSYAK